MKARKAIAPLAFLGVLTSCGEQSVSVFTDATTFNGTEYYDTVGTRVPFDYDYEGNIDERMGDGALNDDWWNALEGTWQNDSASKPHAGMQNRNLFYIHDGDETYLGFRGRGLYCQDEDMSKSSTGQVLPEGAGIITKEKLIPGRYEIEMAAFPRYGGVSACWTYLCETGNEATDQNEIDIEIGGHTDGQTFKYMWATSWTTHTNKATEDVDVSEIAYLNDGKFHKYTFDWYTDYLDTGLGRVDWFMDGILIASIRGSLVTDKQMPLWIGLWFPNWTNNASFDTDYMIMKSFKFTAFDSSQYYEESRSNISYTQTTPSQAGIGSIDYESVQNINKIANSGFDTWDEVPLDGTHYGWEVPASNNGTVMTVNDEFSLTASEAGRAYVRQKWEEAYEGYEFDYSFAGRLADASSSAKMEIHYTNTLGVDVATATTIDITSTDMSTYNGTLVAPERCRNIEFRFYGESGTAYVDDVSVIYKGNTNN